MLDITPGVMVELNMNEFRGLVGVVVREGSEKRFGPGCWEIHWVKAGTQTTEHQCFLRRLKKDEG